MRSKVLQQTEVKLMGLQLNGALREPTLYIGTTNEIFQEAGNIPLAVERLPYIIYSGQATTSAHAFKMDDVFHLGHKLKSC